MSKFKFNRQEIAGSFGDMGTDFPLVIGLITLCHVSTTNTLILFGLCQILTGLIYKLPMPVQPLKYMAMIMLTQKLTPDLLYAGGFCIGIMMLILSGSGFLEKIKTHLSLIVVRGIQLGLALTLIKLSLTEYLHIHSFHEVILYTISLLIGLMVFQFKKFPSSLIMILLGIVYSMYFKNPNGLSISLPEFSFSMSFLNQLPQALIVLAIPQLALSLSNSVFATEQTIKDLFPGEKISIKKIGLTYSMLNIISPFLNGIPLCHGSGGLVGHYTFGARTGTSVIIYGVFYLTIGFLFSQSFNDIIAYFPLPVLAAILSIEALGLMNIMRKDYLNKKNVFIITSTALICILVKNGFFFGLIWGFTIDKLTKKIPGLARD